MTMSTGSEVPTNEYFDRPINRWVHLTGVS